MPSCREAAQLANAIGAQGPGEGFAVPRSGPAFSELAVHAADQRWLGLKQCPWEQLGSPSPRGSSGCLSWSPPGPASWSAEEWKGREGRGRGGLKGREQLASPSWFSLLLPSSPTCPSSLSPRWEIPRDVICSF